MVSKEQQMEWTNNEILQKLKIWKLQKSQIKLQGISEESY